MTDRKREKSQAEMQRERERERERAVVIDTQTDGHRNKERHTQRGIRDRHKCTENHRTTNKQTKY